MRNVLFVVESRRRSRDDSRLRTTTEDDDESLSKLATHRAIQQKIDGAVNESQDVEQVAEVEINLGGELAVHSAEDHGDALRQFADEEQYDDGE